MITKFRSVKFEFDVPQLHESYTVKYIMFGFQWHVQILRRDLVSTIKIDSEIKDFIPTVEHADQVLNNYLQHRKN